MTQNSDYTDEDVSLSLSQNWESELQSEVDAEIQEKNNPPLEILQRSAMALWYPAADRSVPMHIRGTYANRYPVGAVVHFTAGRSERGDPDAVQTMKDGKSKHYLYFCISSTGKVYQPAPLDKWGSHCGESSYPGLGVNLGNKLTGIEVCAAGRLEKTSRGYEPWWNKEYPPNSPKRTYYTEQDVRFTEKVENVILAGYYHKYKPAQEASLNALLVWLHKNNPNVFKIKNIVGHDEISGFRGKNDPGGAMTRYMSGLRTHIASLAAADATS